MDKSSSASSQTHTEVGFETKSQVKLFIGERSKTQFDSGCKMFDLMLRDPYHVIYYTNLIIFDQYSILFERRSFFVVESLTQSDFKISTPDICR
jgi:hypothetical protein